MTSNQSNKKQKRPISRENYHFPIESLRPSIHSDLFDRTMFQHMKDEVALTLRGQIEDLFIAHVNQSLDKFFRVFLLTLNSGAVQVDKGFLKTIWAEYSTAVLNHSKCLIQNKYLFLRGDDNFSQTALLISRFESLLQENSHSQREEEISAEMRSCLYTIKDQFLAKYGRRKGKQEFSRFLDTFYLQDLEFYKFTARGKKGPATARNLQSILNNATKEYAKKTVKKAGFRPAKLKTRIQK